MTKIATVCNWCWTETLCGGLRPAEQFALTTEDVSQRTVTVKKALKQAEKNRIGNTKTASSNGYIAISRSSKGTRPMGRDVWHKISIFKSNRDDIDGSRQLLETGFEAAGGIRGDVRDVLQGGRKICASAITPYRPESHREAIHETDIIRAACSNHAGCTKVLLDRRFPEGGSYLAKT